MVPYSLLRLHPPPPLPSGNISIFKKAENDLWEHRLHVTPAVLHVNDHIMQKQHCD